MFGDIYVVQPAIPHISMFLWHVASAVMEFYVDIAQIDVISKNRFFFLMYMLARVCQVFFDKHSVTCTKVAFLSRLAIVFLNAQKFFMSNRRFSNRRRMGVSSRDMLTSKKSYRFVSEVGYHNVELLSRFYLSSFVCCGALLRFVFLSVKFDLKEIGLRF